MILAFTVHGEPASKANSRRLVKIRGRIVSIKSRKAMTYMRDFIRQCPRWVKPVTNDVLLVADIYYSSHRPDLDESLIMDGLEKGGVIKNDRQIREKVIRHYIDVNGPRAEITLYQRSGWRSIVEKK